MFDVGAFAEKTFSALPKYLEFFFKKYLVVLVVWLVRNIEIRLELFDLAYGIEFGKCARFQYVLLEAVLFGLLDFCEFLTTDSEGVDDLGVGFEHGLHVEFLGDDGSLDGLNKVNNFSEARGGWSNLALSNSNEDDE